MSIEFAHPAPSAITPGPAPASRKRSLGPAGRLLAALADLAAHKAILTSHCEQSWASITFAGTRHRVCLEFRGEEAIVAGECFIVFLPEHEFAIPGQLVADAAVTAVDHTADPACLAITCELLLLEEA